MSGPTGSFGLPERYRLEGGIAAGGMAAVYAAHDTVLDRPVAVKVLADHLNDDDVARQRFEREARAAAGLSSHPGVVTIFDVGEHNGRAFLVMERREGGTVGDAGRVGLDRALGWLATIADALDAAHASGVVHRDIKPANLLLDERDRVAVADFGIASLAHDSERFTQTGQVLGTASYLSPEQAAGETATAASDRYSLAVVAYELLSGRKPFENANFAGQARAHMEDAPPPSPGLPPAAQDVLDRGLAKDPRDRWPSAKAFVNALADALEAPVPSAPPPTEATRAMPPPARERSRTPFVVAAVALVLVAGAVAALALSGGGDGKTQRSGGAKQSAKKGKGTGAKQANSTATATATEPPAAATATATATQPPSDDPSALNAQGFELNQSGDYAGAVAPLQQAVDACGDSGELDPCGYALYNLGVALNRSGRPDEAIAPLQQRLDTFKDNDSGDVQKELDDACASSGQDCGGTDLGAKPPKAPKEKKPKG